MRVVIAGSSGLIGSALTASLVADGHDVVRLVRRPPAAATPGSHVTEARWDPAAVHLSASALDGADAVVNLAGAGVGDHRWTPAYKQRVRDSRVLTTATLATTMADMPNPPRVFVAGSAIGYYGETGESATDESGAPGGDFLARVCQEWEAAADPARKAGIRVAHPRFGLVVSAEGGALGRLLPLARLGLGGKLGTGRQYWSYVSRTDAIRALRHIVDTGTLGGPVNVTAPNPERNSEITAEIGRAVRRPMLLAVPGPALRVALGGFAEGVLMSQRIVPARLLASGFEFRHPGFPEALAAALGE
ncbi:TIGR01777 family oxidoreductase [Actinocrinis puniceicyclus]|uniref:TIGR01777 family oxidoreductase n=1 Tax=Actinocrinis puniceicyclus TaxID=977794 RepID=A0A8J8BBA7_9ACTN|nr:TIGR01777 family oxidoreductase [Actinocrinis puniceicyclus]MBS2962933.1 TIGR01777 family oxidoreductase [Actinocrinis puniceicyclus]